MSIGVPAADAWAGCDQIVAAGDTIDGIGRAATGVRVIPYIRAERYDSASDRRTLSAGAGRETSAKIGDRCRVLGSGSAERFDGCRGTSHARAVRGEGGAVGGAGLLVRTRHSRWSWRRWSRRAAAALRWREVSVQSRGRAQFRRGKGGGCQCARKRRGEAGGRRHPCVHQRQCLHRRKNRSYSALTQSQNANAGNPRQESTNWRTVRQRRGK